MLMPLSRAGMEERNLDFAAALAHAVNDWQLRSLGEAGAAAARRHRGAAGGRGVRRAGDRGARRRSRLRADPALAALERSARPSALLADLCGGRARGRPIGLHVQGYSGGHASTGSGWPTYYMQEHYAMCGNMQATVVSLVFEGVFERFPEPEDRADRGRLCLGAGAVLAHGQALAAHARGNAAREAPAVRIRARALLVHHPADRGAGEPAATSPRSWNGSAATG